MDALEKFNPDKVTEEEKDELKRKYGIKEQGFVVGFSGRLVHDKGIVELSQAFGIVKKKYPDKSIKLFIIGEPEKRDAVPQEVLDTLYDNPDVIFTGRIPYADIQKYYLMMDVLVLPSYREGFPTVVLEACSMGVPVIVSKSTGCIDSIKENVTGVYTEIKPDDIAANIERFFDKDFAENMGKRARKYIVDNYDQRIIRKYMLEVLNSLG